MREVYPPHIYDPIRVEIATVFLKRELRKMLPHLKGKEIWDQIDLSVENWFPQDHNLIKTRNFWNGFDGIALGFELKTGFTSVLTAENIHWELKAKLPLDNKLASGGNLKYISEELSENRPRAIGLREFFSRPQNKELANHWTDEFKKHGQSSEPRDHFPIIALQGEDNRQEIYSIYDGNRRMILAILEEKETIPAYIGIWETAEMTPKNFWLPTSYLMNLVDTGKNLNTEGSYQQTLLILKSLLPFSQSGQYEIFNRVLVGNNEFRNKLKRDLGLK